MSVQAEGRGLIHKGDRTTTGGVVTSGVGNVMYVGEGVTQIKMIATCPACKKGQGEIIPLETIAVFVDNIQAALHGDIVACDCSWGSNTLIASAGAMKFSQSNGQVYGFKPHASPQEMEATYQSVASSMGGRYLNAGTTVVEKRKLDNEVLKATEELLIFLPALNLETSVHSQAIKEFSQAFDVILKGYNGENISYETGYDLIHQIKNGFIDGGGTLKKLEENRLSRRTETVGNFSHGGSYRRNLVVNN
ncbi:PAAR domain-containing protein, partial [Vibrio sp. M250220]|uniref:PAAR domain-containing protein n=1 Tax=Vibrio sp. M250220 TaxID=3020894 RepID=UPI002F421223